MRVICVDSKNSTPLFIKEGEKYTVFSYDLETYNMLVYFLQEDPRKLPYDANRFVPVSEIDETAFERNYQNELA